MVKCGKCNAKISLLEWLEGALCHSCKDKEDKLRKVKEAKEEKIERAEEIIQKNTFSWDDATIFDHNEHRQGYRYYFTRLPENRLQVNKEGIINKKYSSMGIDVYIKEKNEIITLLIKHDYNLKKALDEFWGIRDKIGKTFAKKAELEYEKEKIMERERKRKVRETVELEVYGKVKNKRQIFTNEEKCMIFDKFNNECAICGTKEGLHIHHKDQNPKNNQINNLILLCGVCHKKIHMKVR